MRGAHRHKWSPSASALPPRPSTFGRKYLTLVYENTYTNTRNTHTQIQTKNFRSEISHINANRAYLVRKVTNTNQVNSESDIAFKYKPQIVGHKHLSHYICSLSMFSFCVCKISITYIYLENRAQWSENQKIHKTNC